VREKEGEKNIMKETIRQPAHEADMQDYRIEHEPFYLPIQEKWSCSDSLRASFRLLKGPPATERQDFSLNGI
jgi:hypothetical protein